MHVWLGSGKTLSKDSSISDFAWVLQPLAEIVPCQPIHQNSLYKVVAKILPDAAEGMVWLAVYDLRTLLQ